jgi:hypothetical protein
MATQRITATALGRLRLQRHHHHHQERQIKREWAGKSKWAISVSERNKYD